MGDGMPSGEKESGFSRPSLVIWAKDRILGGGDGRIHQKTSATAMMRPAETTIIGHRFAETGPATALSVGNAVEAIELVSVGWLAVEVVAAVAGSTIAGTRDPEDPNPDSISRFKRFKSVRISDADW
jgi:hypothetical protein